MTLRIIFLLALILTASCKEESSVKQEQETTSKQTNEKFIWDFTNPKKYSYTFKQTAETISKLAQNDTPSFSKSEINGLINVVVKKENTADFSLTDATTTFTTFNNDGKIKDTISQALPPNVIENIQPNSTAVASSNLNILLNIVFPLPLHDIAIGEINKIPMQMPFNVRGSALEATGFNTLTYAGDTTFEGEQCAILKGKIDISKLDLPKELSTGEYKCSTIGEAVYYFNYNKHYFVAVDAKVNMAFLVNVPANSEKVTRAMYSEMTSDNVYSLRLKEIVPVNMID